MPRDSHGGNAVKAFLHNGAHVVAFGLVAMTLWLLRLDANRGSAAPAGVYLLAMVYGLLDELHQRHVPGRACSVVDLLSDSVGAGLAIAVAQWRLVGEQPYRQVCLYGVIAAIGAVSLATWGPW